MIGIFISIFVGVPAHAEKASLKWWSDVLIADARAYHAEQTTNHPGPHNTNDPLFKDRLDSALNKALERANSVGTPGGYMFAMREMVASFNDGHMYIGFNDKLDVTGEWPGFVAAYSDGNFIVRYASTDGKSGLEKPAVGERIVECDGRSPQQLLAELVAPWRGGWSLEANRERQGWRVFHDYGNPWVKRPVSCRFEGAGKSRDIMLVWSPQPANFLDLVTSGNASSRAPIELRDFSEGIWISAGTFDDSANSPAEKTLPALVETVKARQADIRAAPALVLDLRGNSGGSSDWGAQMARIFWGAAMTDSASLALGSDVRVDWRATPNNLAAVNSFCRPMVAGTQGASAEAIAWCQSIMSGLNTTIASGHPLWREPYEPKAHTSALSPNFAARRQPTYLLVDSACGSACLDTVDLWTALGAIPVGRTTNADSDYMEVRSAPLPSGYGEFSVPMKVYSGRKRGSGVPVEPVRRYPGSIGDTAAVERWIASF
jgi:hypothetical protein